MAEKSRRVGIPIDGSENSKKAVDWYMDNVADESDHVIFIRVQEFPDLPLLNLKSGLNIPTDYWMKTITERNTVDEEMREEMERICRRKNLSSEYVTVVDKRPGEGIVSKAEELGVKMIVMGCRGLSTLRRTILGSVSDYVLHHSQVPICIVPADYTRSPPSCP